MEIKNNPVGRLHDILREARAHGNGTRVGEVWRSVLNLPENDTGALLKGIAGVIQLHSEGKQAIVSGVPGDQNIFLAPFTRLEALFADFNLNAQWSSSRQILDEATLSALAFGNHYLEPIFRKSAINSDLISEFLDTLDSLLHQCLESDLPPPIKKLFRDSLEALRSVLLSYKISGPDGIQDEIDRIMGAMSRHTSEIRKHINEPSNGFMKATFDIIRDINDSVQFAESVTSLAGPAAVTILPLLNNFLS